jgi:thiamine biosynthesis protein ThiI
MKLIVKVFPEITIKSPLVRKNFIRQLAKNIRAVTRDLDPHLQVSGVWDNLEVQCAVGEPKLLQEIVERLTRVPGIVHFLQVEEYPLGDFSDVLDKCRQHFAERLPGKIFSVRCKRAGEPRAST